MRAGEAFVFPPVLLFLAFFALTVYFLYALGCPRFLFLINIFSSVFTHKKKRGGWERGGGCVVEREREYTEIIKRVKAQYLQGIRSLNKKLQIPKKKKKKKQKLRLFKRSITSFQRLENFQARTVHSLTCLPIQ